MKPVKAALISLAFACFAIVTLRQQPQPYSKPDPANKDCWPPDGDKPYRATNEAPRQHWHPEEKQHRRWEKGYWIASVWLTLAAGIGAGLSAKFAYQAAIQAQITNSMNAESGRAWLGVRYLNIREPLVVNQPIYFLLSYDNLGKEPARETDFLMEYHSFDAKRYPDEVSTSVLQSFQARCFSLNTENTKAISFPSNETSGRFVHNLSTNDEEISSGD